MSGEKNVLSASDIPAISKAPPVELSHFAAAMLWGLLFFGGVTAVFGVLGPDPRPVWLTLQVNFVYWFSLAAASSCFPAFFQASNASWPRPLLRLFEAALPLLFAAGAFLAVMYLGHKQLFVWAWEEMPGKGIWLQSESLYLRDIALITLLAFLASRVIRCSSESDAIAASCAALDGIAQEKVSRLWRSRSRLSVVVVIAYAVVMTLIAIDQVMSIDPKWYSTLFGAFIFMSAIYLAVAWAAIWQYFAREGHPLFKTLIRRETLHDLGKLLLGFCIFWAYLFWSHYLTIWYGNIPEETHWVIVRMRLEPWHSFAWITFGFCFIVPFFVLLNKDLKRVPALLALSGVIVAVGLWLQSYILLAPSIYPEEIPLSMRDFVITLGFLSGYLLMASRYLRRHAVVPFGDLLLPPEL